MMIAASGVAPPALANDFIGDLVRGAVERAVQSQVPQASDIVRGATAGNGTTPSGGSSKVKLEDGDVFHPEYIVRYWRQPDASGRGWDESSDAPGNINRQPAYGGDPKQRGAAEVRRKLERILERILLHPALKDVRGASIRAGVNLAQGKAYPSGSVAAGSLTVLAYPINLQDKATIRYGDGTYHTGGGNEGTVLTVSINQPGTLEERSPKGTYNGITVVARGGGYMLFIPNTDRPHTRTERNIKVMNHEINDPTRTPGDIQFLTIYVATSSNVWSEMSRGLTKPTSTMGRLMGVMFTMDWQAILRDVNP